MSLKEISMAGEAIFEFDTEMMVDSDYKKRDFDYLKTVFIVSLVPGIN